MLEEDELLLVGQIQNALTAVLDNHNQALGDLLEQPLVIASESAPVSNDVPRNWHLHGAAFPITKGCSNVHASRTSEPALALYGRAPDRADTRYAVGTNAGTARRVLISNFALPANDK